MTRKYPYLYEIPIFYIALVGANRLFFPEIQGFLGIDPHPYWIGIFLFGFRYGIGAGLTSGLISAILYLSSTWAFGERYLFEDGSFYVLPAFFVLIGILVGLGTMGARRRVARLEKEAGGYLKEAKSLAGEIKTLQEVNRGLEKRIVTRTATLITLYEGARRLESFRLEDLYVAILNFIAKTLEVEECALYLRVGDQWKLKQSLGWKEYQKRPEAFGLNEGITGMAGFKNKILSVRDFIGRPSGDEIPQMLGDCLVAGPLRKGENGPVIGVVSIQGMSLLDFSSATVSLLSFLLNWASRSIGRALYVQELETKDIIDPELQVYSYSYFLSRSRQEMSRSKTYYLPLSMGLVEIPGIEGLSPPQKGKLLSAISQLIKETLREMDVVARYPDESVPLAFLLITVSQGQSLEFRERILKSFSQLEIVKIAGTAGPIGLRIGLASFVPQLKEIEELIELAKKDLGDVV